MENKSKRYARVLKDNRIVEIYYVYSNGIGYIGKYGIKTLFDGEFEMLEEKVTK